MQKSFIVLILLVQSLSWSGKADAAICASSSDASYLGLGSFACNLGKGQSADDAPPTTQADAIRSTAIRVVPIVVGSAAIGPQFVVLPVSAGGSAFDDLITSRVTGVAPHSPGATVDVADSGKPGEAAVSVGEPLCLGASGCDSGSAGTLAVIDVGPVGALPIAGDLAQDSGGAVQGSGGTPTAVVDFVGVQAVPEPTTGVVLAAGLLAFVLSRRRRR